MHMTKAMARAGRTLSNTGDEYRKDIAMVSAYVATVVNTKLPSLLQPIPGWSDYQKAYLLAETTALAWTNQVMGPLSQTPLAVKRADAAVRLFFAAAAQALVILQRDPTNPGARESLLNQLNGLQSEIVLAAGLVKIVIDDLENYNGTLPAQSANLAALADAMISASSADQQKIATLRSQIAALQAQIDDLTRQIVALGIVDGAAVVFGVVALAFAGPAGIPVALLLGAALVTASIYIAVDSEKITEKKSDIEKTTATMNEITMDMALLNESATAFGDLASRSLAIQQNLEGILSAWDAVSKAVGLVKQDISQATDDEKQALWDAVAADLAAAEADWTTVLGDVDIVAIDLEGNAAKISLGMSRNEVAAAIAATPTTTLVRYLNAA